MTYFHRSKRAVVRASVIVLVVAVGATVLPGISSIAAAPTHGSSTAMGASGSDLSPSLASSASRNAGEAMASSAMAAVHALGLSPRVVSVPRPSATPQEIAAARVAGYVTPLYRGTPAPIGVADYGLSAGPHGTVVPSILSTTRVRGEIDTTSGGIEGLDLADSSPDAFGIQLNAVQTNVTLFGQPGYSFWTQDIALYNPAVDQLYLDSNIWNWSSGPLTPNVFYEHGPYGVQVDQNFYYAFVGPFTVTYPFDLTFYLNSSLIAGRDAVNFTATISSAAGTIIAPWDYAVFNSTAPGGRPLTEPSNYTANGFEYNPIGLTDDFEMILGGPNDGSQADLVNANANIALSYWLPHHGFRPVPSAYSYGGETGETVTGAYVGWSDSSGGPGGVRPYGVVSTGPEILSGLWHAGRPEGVVPVWLHISPSNAFVFLAAAPNAFTISALEYAPTLSTSTLYLSPGTYTFLIELSDHAPATGALTVAVRSGSRTTDSLYVQLPTDYRYGVYTPLFAWENAQLPAISYFGAGIPWDPYFLVNNQFAPLGPLFGLVNDYGYPVFPGVLLVNTTASVTLYRPATFATEFRGEFIENYTNALPLWFSGVKHVGIVDGTNVTGWFGDVLYLYPYWTPFDIVFYNSVDNLVAGNTINVDGGGGILLFGFTGGGNNTVWGNTIDEVSITGYNFAIPYSGGLGILVGESGDTIYNNYVATPTTGWQSIVNLYTGYYQLYSDRWNLSVQPSWHVHFAPGFPLVPLVGSIIGTSWQGGNFWWDYGIVNPYNGANNPFGVLPYTENATTPLGNSPYIYPGGDYAPLNYVGPP